MIHINVSCRRCTRSRQVTHAGRFAAQLTLDSSLSASGQVRSSMITSKTPSSSLAKLKIIGDSQIKIMLLQNLLVCTTLTNVLNTAPLYPS
jgi:hypothetical protein